MTPEHVYSASRSPSQKINYQIPKHLLRGSYISRCLGLPALVCFSLPWKPTLRFGFIHQRSLPFCPVLLAERTPRTKRAAVTFNYQEKKYSEKRNLCFKKRKSLVKPRLCSCPSSALSAAHFNTLIYGNKVVGDWCGIHRRCQAWSKLTELSALRGTSVEKHCCARPPPRTASWWSSSTTALRWCGEKAPGDKKKQGHAPCPIS